MAEIRELFEKFRRGDRGFLEEVIAAITLMQGQLDPNSFMAGLLLGKGMGRGSGGLAALLPLLLASNPQQQQQQQMGGPTTTNLLQLLPLFLLMGKEEGDDYPEKFELFEKASGGKASSA